MYSNNLIGFTLVIVLSVTSLSLADSKFVWSDCGSTAGTISNVVVKDCDTERCILKRNENASLSITFKSKVHSPSVQSVVYGEVLGFKQKFGLPNPNACEEVGLTCPLEPENTYTYSNTIFVKRAYPKVTVDIYWELRDDKGQKIFCAIIPAKIDNPQR